MSYKWQYSIISYVSLPEGNMKYSEMIAYPSDPNFPKFTPGPFVVSSSLGVVSILVRMVPPMMNLVVAIPSNGYSYSLANWEPVGAAMSFPMKDDLSMDWFKGKS